MVKILLALFAFFSLFSLGTPSHLGLPLDGTLFRDSGNELIASPSTAELRHFPSINLSVLRPMRSPGRETLDSKDLTFSDAYRLMWEVSLRDTKHLSLEATRILQNSFASGRATLTNCLEKALGALLWMIVWIWSSVIWAFGYWTFYMVTTFTMPVVCLALLFAFTKFMVLAAEKMLAGWPVYLGKLFLRLLKTASTALFSKRNYVPEKSVKGFISVKIPQSPPRGSVLLIQHDDGSHAGYASCVKLYDGTLALMTCEHVATGVEGGRVVSAKTRNKIPLNLFTPLLISQKGDFALLSGPPNWESLLGCKGAMFVPASQLAKSKMRFYFVENEEWMADHGEVVSARDHWFATTLCNSEPGFSGTPIFNGKTIIGVHAGSEVEENSNLMSVIPPVPGLTTPQYVYETTAPQGRLFIDEDVSVLLKSVKTRIPDIAKYVSVSGKNWADYRSDDDDDFFESSVTFEGETKPAPIAEPVTPPIQFGTVPEAPVGKQQWVPRAQPSSGNEKGRAVCQNNSTPAVRPKPTQEARPKQKAPATSTPPKQQESLVKEPKLPELPKSEQEMFEKLMAKMVERIDLSAIEKKVVQVVAEKAMKKPKGSPRKRSRKTSKPTSEDSTNGRYQPPHKRSPASSVADASRATTSQSKSKEVVGAPSSSKNTQSWAKKSQASAGH
ncbi:P1 [African eggplant yellowing virus]|uniref:p1 n=1 Tax=African eggplant yellowing virus TaxID=1963256 RepID=A0A1S6PCU5_9VIRU|nr:P1 [African eggplant yellowing virus]AQU42695.1 P1 [African eggplant yellowing virus]